MYIIATCTVYDSPVMLRRCSDITSPVDCSANATYCHQLSTESSTTDASQSWTQLDDVTPCVSHSLSVRPSVCPSVCLSAIYTAQANSTPAS